MLKLFDGVSQSLKYSKHYPLVYTFIYIAKLELDSLNMYLEIMIFPMA